MQKSDRERCLENSGLSDEETSRFSDPGRRMKCPAWLAISGSPSCLLIQMAH